MNEKISMDKIKNDLKQFIGTEHYYSDFMGLKLTDGVKYFAEKYSANWLVSDAAVIVMMKLKNHPFISLDVNISDKETIFNYTDGNDNVLFKQKYSLVDLPNGSLKFFISNGVMMLPSEY